MKWLALAKKISDSPRKGTDRTDKSPFLVKNNKSIVPKSEPTEPTEPTELTEVPNHLQEFLSHCGYSLPTWSPWGCRYFLEQLQAEWPSFEVRGWHGLTMPDCWPVTLMEAVQSIYVQSILCPKPSEVPKIKKKPFPGTILLG
jgi:hypothetical protein